MMEPADTAPPPPPPHPETAGDAALRAIHAAAVAAKVEPEPLTLPADYLCAGCNYPSGASGSVGGSMVCPECGRRATRIEVDAQAARRAVVEWWKDSGQRVVVRRWVLVVVAYSIGAAVVARSLTILLATPTVLALAVWMSWQAGWVVARLKREGRRAHTLVVWRRSLWRLHLPWLVAPLFVVVAGLAGLVDVWMSVDGGGVGLYWGMAFIGLAMWVIGCLVAFAVWWVLYLGWGAQDVTGVTGVGGPRGGAPVGRSEAAAFVLGVGVMLGASGLGFSAGVVAAGGVAEWLGLESMFVFDEDW